MFNYLSDDNAPKRGIKCPDLESLHIQVILAKESVQPNQTLLIILYKYKVFRVKISEYSYQLHVLYSALFLKV